MEDSWVKNPLTVIYETREFRINCLITRNYNPQFHDLKLVKRLGYLLDGVKSLLYQIFIKEQGWVFGEKNPSRLEVVNERLNDRYTLNCVWFIAESKIDDQIVGCTRLVETVNGKLEVERYPTCSKLRAFFADNGGSEKFTEMNRIAVAKDFRGKPIAYMLVYSTTIYAKEVDKDIFATTGTPSGSALAEACAFTRLPFKFRFEPHDPHEVDVWVALRTNFPRVRETLHTKIVSKL